MKMDHYPKGSLSYLTVLSLLFAGFLYLWITTSSSTSNPLLPIQSQYNCLPQNPEIAPAAAIAVPRDDLELVLSKASMPNRTVIITFVNRAYADPGAEVDAGTTLLDLFIRSLWLGEGTRGLLDHVVVVAMDRAAYRMCRFRRLNCYRLETDGVDFRGEKVYMSEDFIRMMWRRTAFLGDVLKRGYNFIFTDTDVMWLRNPFTKLSRNESEDLQISTDVFNGNPWSEDNFINTGFYSIRSNNKTVALFDEWYSRRENATGKKEQDVLLGLVREGVLKRLDLRVRFLDTIFFSGFCEDSKDFTEVTTVHANCCRSITAKVFDLTAVLRDWKRFKLLRKKMAAANGTVASWRWTNHMGCWRAWGVRGNRNN
ncbi:LOW QUALITY PROTEIN: uncharacterized protein At1g28695-like [Rhodamnia argentea]|uniref:LOW QUALITY PROTEIN: uncharacterized protein At1g28695-like n=1 Tax=Rhodamnia argentea TaxID=178133 RepID=A0A8B8R3H4_9MYRT|nr:LOW QUALITY PROTEIN: uncharacterized protein At1g28695-like [Rhodamnia argentea]